MSGGTAAGSQPKKHLLQTLHARLQSCIKILSVFTWLGGKTRGKSFLDALSTKSAIR